MTTPKYQIRLFVGQIPSKVTNNSLKSLLQEYGCVHDVSILIDKKSGKTKHCAFAYVDSIADGEDLISKLDGKYVFPDMKNPIHIDFANHKETIPSEDSSISSTSKSSNSYSSVPRKRHSRKSSKKHNNGSSNDNSSNTNLNFCNNQKLSQNGSDDEKCCNSEMFNPYDQNTCIFKNSVVTNECNHSKTKTNSNSNSNSNLTTSINLTNTTSSVVSKHQQEAQYSQHPNSSSSETIASPSYPMYSISSLCSNQQSMVPLSYSTIQNCYIPCSYPNVTISIPYINMQSFSTNGAKMVSDVSGYHNEGPMGANLFIYYIPSSFDERRLFELFQPFGTILSIKIYTDKLTNESRGFGFVSYSTVEEADIAISYMNGYTIEDKALKVQKKKEKNTNYSMYPNYMCLGTTCQIYG